MGDPLPLLLWEPPPHPFALSPPTDVLPQKLLYTTEELEELFQSDSDTEFQGFWKSDCVKNKAFSLNLGSVIQETKNLYTIWGSELGGRVVHESCYTRDFTVQAVEPEH